MSEFDNFIYALGSIAKLQAAQYVKLLEEGVPPESASVIIGTQFGMTMAQILKKDD